MLTIRLIKIGKKNSPSFRLVLTDKKNPPRGGRFLEILGNYNPRSKEINLKKERLVYWLAQGAKTSDTVHNLLVSQAVIPGPKIRKNIKIKKKAEEIKKKETEETSGVDKSEKGNKIE